MFWGGWALSGLSIVGFVMSASMKLMQKPEMVQGFEKDGFPSGSLFWIGVTELVCAIIYAIPRTNVLGATLLTAYLGGAVVTHVRTSSSFLPAIILGVFVWGGLFLRDARIRALTPVRRDP